tara:strand:- start:1731 stop:2561 length:831 start_codon:yes stop_codon:yes gene_type:complete
LALVLKEQALYTKIVVANSVTTLGEECCGHVVLAGSHGATYAAFLAVKSGARGIILNDAGRAKDESGISGGEYCDGLDVPFATVGSNSCRIGNGESMKNEGIISYVNNTAKLLGVELGMPAIIAANKLTSAKLSDRVSREYSEARKELTSGASKRKIVLMDSISLVTDKDKEKIVVSGSHGGMLGKDPKTAMKYDAFAGFFHDAGVGKNGAGVTRLMPLNERGIIAATVDGMSARIGDGDSVYNDGVISHFNSEADKVGCKVGMKLKTFIDIIIKM